MTPILSAARRAQRSVEPILKAKLARPNLAANVLDRPHLVRAIVEHADTPLTLVVAEAGYGKTTLLAAATRSLNRPVVWYSLMPSDADPVMFTRYIVEGFRRGSPRFGRPLLQMLAESRPSQHSPEVLGGTLANAMRTLAGPRHVLVLDDFHEVAHNAAVIGIVDTLLRHLPDRVRLLIASRSAPPLSLERLRARSEVFELNSQQLRFQPDELARLYSEVYLHPLSSDDLTRLEEATLGWPTAVHLIQESLRRSPRASLTDVLENFAGSDLDLHAYLSAEVLGRLDPTSRLLLERTAAVDRFDPELASTLTGLRDTRARLDALARRGLLRSFGTGAQASYECHDLVRRFVRGELEEREGPEAWPALEAATATALRARGESERALRHAIHGSATPLALELLRELAPGLIRQGRAATALEFLSQLPDSAVEADAPLALARADALQALGQWDQAEREYERTLARSREGGDRDLECRALIGLGKVLNLRGQPERVLGMAERGLAMVAGITLETHVRLLQMKSGAHFYLGQYRASVKILDHVRALLPAGADQELVVPTIHNLAIAHASRGHFRDAAREFRAALAHVRGNASPRAPMYLSNLALLELLLGELVEARRAAEEGLKAAQQFSNRAQELTCLESLAEILARGGDLDGALSALKQAEELNAELRMEVLSADLLALRGRIFCARGQYRRGVEFIRQAVERTAKSPESPRSLQFRSMLAWCELRAGRPHVAAEILSELVAHADRGENDDTRMRAHYWYGEARLAIGDSKPATRHLSTALRLVREQGYSYFLSTQTKENAEPLLYALRHEMEPDVCVAALSEAGSAVEEPLLEVAAKGTVRAAEAALSILGEVGGETSERRLPEIARTRTSLRSSARTALKHVSARRTVSAEPSAASARLVLFGHPRLDLDGVPVPASAWRTQRAFHLLAYLAMHPRGATRDLLIDAFWPGRQAAAGRRNFHPTLSYVRKVLPAGNEAPLLRDGEVYRLNPAYSLACDLWDFEAALEAARSARRPAERRQALEHAADICAQPYLDGCDGRWVDESQSRMRDRVERLMLDLGELASEQDDQERALACFRRAAEFDEFRESTHVSVIQCLVRMGSRRAAIVEYERLKTLLRRELDADPLPETEEAVTRLLRAETAQAGDSSNGEQSTGRQRVAQNSQVPLKTPS